MIFSVIWIKTVTLIGVLMMTISRADMTLDEVEATLQFEITTDATSIRINPEGPLNFLRGYIYQKMECMYNKRFFAPQIDIDYNVKEDPNATSPYDICEFARNEQQDAAYKALTDSKMDIYAEKYHDHLIDLFPSPTGDITIETRGNQSFVQFLRAEKTEKHALQILAMLLLFSEGVNIPIAVTNSVLKVYEPSKKDEIYFEVPMAIPWLNPATGKEGTFQQKKVKQMISFFQENATNHEVLGMMEDKCSLEEVATGKFLDSPKFLIQSYIFGFIDTAERAKEFIQTVHTMTEKYTPKTEAPSKDDSVYDRMFSPAGIAIENIEGTGSMALMKDTQEILNKYRGFPFTDSTQLPSYTSVPWRDPTNKVFSTDRLKDYSNCVECMILSLFCCLAYDPNDFTYKTGHMGDVSPSLKEFFSPENQPFDTKKVEFQKRWSTVVACLNEPSIAYCRKRNELDCGIINMLLVIAEIVNISKEEKEKIFGFSESLKKRKGDLDYKLCEVIKEYTQALLKRISNTNDIEIKFTDLAIDKYHSGRYDISGYITIIFEHNNIKNTIVLDISENHSSITMKPAVMMFKDDRMEKMREIAAKSKNDAVFIENLFTTYINYEIRNIDTPQKNMVLIKEQVHKVVQSNFSEINRLLLVKKINDLMHKKDLLSCSILYSMTQNLSPNHPIIRFTSNILGSTELKNPYTQVNMFPAIVYAGLQSKKDNPGCFPRMQLGQQRYNFFTLETNLEYYLDFILSANMDVFIAWINYFIGYFDKSLKSRHPLLMGSLNRSIYQYIFKNRDMKCSNEIDMLIIKKRASEADRIISELHFIWMVYLCAEENPDAALIRRNLCMIDEPEYITSECASFINTNSIYNRVIQTLNSLKDQICRSEDDIEKFKKVVSILLTCPSGGSVIAWK
ncbi:hypothetical protein NEAUS03_0111 [Nematocida ausubeli]|nr:hypothetical protein NEAUS03_0111 [Nematocida ausubeli]